MTNGSSWYISDDQMSGERSEVAHEIGADLRSRNSKDPQSLSGFKPKNPRILVSDESKESFSEDGFENVFPNARGYASAWVTLARWCQDELVIRGMHWAGLSRGSASPDSIASRPWGLLLAYVLALAPVLACVWFRSRMQPPYRRMAWLLAAVLVMDYFLTLFLAGGPGFSIY